MANEMFQARLPDDFAKEVHEYREKNHMSKSEAVRHLIRAGLEAETSEDDTDSTGGTYTPLERLATRWTVAFGGAVLMLGALLLMAAYILAVANSTALAFVVAGLSSGVIAAGTGFIVIAALAQLALARPLRGLLLGARRDAA